MNLPYRHHYLPVFYLNRWSSDGRIVRYHRPHDKVVVSRHAPNYTGYENGLYTLQGVTPAQAQMLEVDFFQTVDNDAAPVLEHLVTRGVDGLNSKTRSAWTCFMMSLQLRGPQSVAEVKFVLDQHLREVINRVDGPHYMSVKRDEDPDSAYEYALQHAPEQMRNTHKALLPALIDNANIGNLMVNMNWAVIDVTAADQTLLTADRPYTQSHGLGANSCVIAIPLSPTKIFIAANDVTGISLLRTHPVSATVHRMNELMVGLAVRNVYGCTDTHLSFVEQRLRRPTDPPVPGVMVRDFG